MKVFPSCSAIFLIFCLMMALLPVSASAGTYDIFTYEIKSGEVNITGCAKNTTGKVVIPDTIEGYPVTAIGESAFSGQRNISKITLPETVNTIGKLAFYQCESMTGVNLPSGLTTIEYGTFSLCTNLTSLYIPATVTKINPEAFSCRKLSSLTVEEGNPIYYSTGNCVIKTATKEVVVATVHSTIPTDGSVTSIGNYAFRGQTELKAFTVPHGITTVRGNAFFDCTNLSSFHLSDTVTELSPYFKNNFKSITTLTVDENNPVYHSSGNCIIETATKTLIRGCSSSTIPADGSVTSIGYSAFYYSNGLTGLTIPSAVSQIGSDCLRSCKDLQSVTILNPDAQINGGANTFYGDVTIYGYIGSTAEAYAKECGKTFAALDPHTCAFDQKVNTDKYLSTPASCTAPAKYFYSCTCGEKGTKTFTHGNVLAHTYDNACDSSCNACEATRTAPHAFSDTWKSSDRVHWHECTCGAKFGESPHTWDIGTVTQKPTETENGTLLYTCTICGTQLTENITPIPGVMDPTDPTEPAPTEPTVPSQTAPTVQTQTNPSESTAPTTSKSPAPQDEKPSLIWIIPVSLVGIGLVILIIFLLKRKKEKE